jgi:protein O-mannosyl-transferase
MKASQRLSISVLVALSALTLWAYWGVQQNDFVALDDYDYVVQNRNVREGFSLEGILWAFTRVHSNNWHPLTWLSHMLDAEVYRLNPAGHHWSNVLLHMVNTLLLFLAFERMTGAAWKSAFVAALFSLHPLHVESVAWISERKDVLSGLFFFATLLTYVRYVETGGTRRFALALFLFALGLLCKPMLVTLPFLLLLLDYWPLGRIHVLTRGNRTEGSALLHLCKEKIPFFLLSGGSSVITYWVQQGSGAVVSAVPLEIRLTNAVVSYVRYVFKMFWPLDLACFYPHPVHSLKTWQVAGSVLFLIAVTFPCIRYARRHPYLPVGWLWFLGSLVPVIGLVQVGEQAMADRYTYLPLTGLFLMVAWGIPAALARWKLPRWLFPGSWAILLPVLLFLTQAQVKTWSGTVTLQEHDIRVTRDNFMAHFHLAGELAQQGRLEEAHQHFSEALRIRPNFQLGLHHMGNLLMRMGRPDEAMGFFTRALQIDSRDHKTHTNMGFLLLQQGRVQEAMEHFSEALRINPEDRIARHNLEVARKRLRP